MSVTDPSLSYNSVTLCLFFHLPLGLGWNERQIVWTPVLVSRSLINLSGGLLNRDEKMKLRHLLQDDYLLQSILRTICLLRWETLQFLSSLVAQFAIKWRFMVTVVNEMSILKISALQTTNHLTLQRSQQAFTWIITLIAILKWHLMSENQWCRLPGWKCHSLYSWYAWKNRCRFRHLHTCLACWDTPTLNRKVFEDISQTNLHLHKTINLILWVCTM